MTSQSLASSHPSAYVRWLTTVRERHTSWFMSAIGFFGLAAICLAASFIDERTFNGVSVWIKPFKFSVSIAVYFATLAWFAPLLRPGFFATTQGRWLTALPIAASVFEVGYITLQAARAEASHFNTSTTLYSVMYDLMAFGAVLLVSVCVWMAVVIVKFRGVRDPYVLAVVAGLIGTFLLGGGFGGYLGNANSHWVGGAQTDAGGLPIVNWSTNGGDLRVAHFVGMHAMQLIPMFGALVMRWFRTPQAVLAVVVFTVAYAAFATATFIQAIAGEPLLRVATIF